MVDCDLRGCGVLVTRAAHQSEQLARMIEACEGRAVRLPAIEIQPCRDPSQAQQLLTSRWDWIIFVSPNAVHNGLKLLAEHGLADAGIGAVGASTARQLKRAGISVDLIPDRGYDSEGLLSLPELNQVDGLKILIVRGEGGRALLGDTLQARGAKVRYAEVYRRVRPDPHTESLLAGWSENVQLVTTTSREILQNLVEIVGEAGWSKLSQTPLVVISERMELEAQQMGFSTIIKASGADDRSLMEAICHWVE
ncbi:MAG: uroporphyrinogen-III synthase [Candidatus Thiodiazotropha weberae]|nr:uroporphyrinogen-III synthase [Candidatus Thiodiazotropha lotti]MCG8012765.1 uroporphyrinogen-III synthase [Candidatus Thiodiazotropha lotti]MCG8021754.1 uroporphyrinogen-III synthase [Candidatus Thiodiazotropha lotti]MCW4208925.1 uroporphyrinogen-III synthase [Candidatus Thiodiazotropha lotti]MCW4212235.1 uroporphyrinogen-III synthase [Candidatus Thiodiazotropha lotti]